MSEQNKPTPREHRNEQIECLTRTVVSEQADLEAFARLLLRRHGVTPQVADVEDALSEAYSRAVARIRRDPGAPIRHFGAWYRKFLALVCYEIARRQNRSYRNTTVEELQAEDEVLSLLHRASEESRDPSLFLYAQELLALLPEDEQWLLMKSMKGYTSQEIAREKTARGKKVTANWVRKKRTEALRKLQRKMGLA